MEVIHVTKDEVLCDESDIESYVNVLNGIIYNCQRGHYSPLHGERNEMIVNMCVSSHMLGLDALEVLGKMEKHKLILRVNDDEDPGVRVYRCTNYTNRFEWDWMLNPGYYDSLGAYNIDALNELKVEID